MIHFRHIGHRLLASVGSVVILGIVALTVTYALRQEAASVEQNESALGLVARSVAESVAALMQGGHSKVAPDLATRLGKLETINDYQIVRLDGTLAFTDNMTFEQVRQRKPDFEFIPRSANPVQAVPAGDVSLDRMRSTGQPVFRYRTLPGGERLVTVYSPIPNAEACHECHGGKDRLRGAVTLTVSMADIDRNVEKTWQLAIMVVAGALLAMVSLIYWFAHRTVIAQLLEFREAMDALAAGDTSRRLSAGRRDEIGDMARAFNRMSEGLKASWEGLINERNKLNTVIHGANTGIVVTDGAQRIVLVNPAAETLLGRTAEDVTRRGFLTLFDDPDWLLARIQESRGRSTPALRTWGDRLLAVRASTIRDGTVVGSAALIRDVTEEKRLENELERQSITDSLTGIFNRRHFDDVLETEYKRWKRYTRPLSVMMIDVDHFKKFNDTHGHDCGDHVLSAIGRVLLELSAPAQIPCRYGGEEMVVVMPGVVEEAGAVLAEAVRRRIAELVVDGLQVTASIGVAGLPGHETATADALVKLADDALYRAKSGGRNRICRAAVT